MGRPSTRLPHRTPAVLVAGAPAALEPGQRLDGEDVRACGAFVANSFQAVSSVDDVTRVTPCALAPTRGLAPACRRPFPAGFFALGELARLTGTKVETIRYYERIGVLQAPARTGANNRAYAKSDVERLSFVRRARELGVTLDQVRALLRLSDDREQSCAEVDRLAVTQLAEVDRRIADLRMLRQELSDLIGQCRHGTIADCRIIEVLGGASRHQPGA